MSYTTTDIESLLRLPPLEVIDARGVDRVGGDRRIQASGGVASACDLLTHDGECLVPIIRIDLGELGDDRHEEVLALKRQGGR